MVYYSPYNPTEIAPESTLVNGLKTYIFRDKEGNITRTETLIDEEIFDTTVHVQLYPIEQHNYYIEYNLLDPKKVKSKLYKRGANTLWRIDYDKNVIPHTLTVYNNQNEAVKTLKYKQNNIWEEKRVIKNGFFYKKTEIVQYRENPLKGSLMYYHITRDREELFFDENGQLSKITQKDMIGNVLKTMDAHWYNLNFDEETGTYTAVKKTKEELANKVPFSRDQKETDVVQKTSVQTPHIQEKANVTDKFDDQHRIIERLYHDDKNVSYKKETYTYDETGYVKTSWSLNGAFWHKHGHEVRYSLQNEIVSADYYNDHNLVPETQAGNELKIYAENYADNSYVKTLKGKLSKINILKLVDLTKEAIEHVCDMVRLNPDRFELKTVKIINSFPQENNQITIPFTNLEALDLSEANLNNLDKVVIPDSSTELKARLNKVKGPEIDFSECHRIEKLTLDLSNSPTVKRFVFPPNMKELNLSIDNMAQLECIDLSAYKDLKINFSYKGNPKHKGRESYSFDFSYQDESDRFEAIKKLALFAEIQNRKKKATKLQIKLHAQHALMQKETAISPVEEKKTESVETKTVQTKVKTVRSKASVKPVLQPLSKKSLKVQEDSVKKIRKDNKVLKEKATRVHKKADGKIVKKPLSPVIDAQVEIVNDAPIVRTVEKNKNITPISQGGMIVQEEVKVVAHKRIMKAHMTPNLNNHGKVRE